MQTQDTEVPDETTSKQEDAAKLKFAMDALSAISTREKEFETGWWKQAEAAEKIYAADDGDQGEKTPYNILYSNTEVLLPSLYSSTPKPDIRGRYNGLEVKPIPEILNRFLTVAADPAAPGGECFDNAVHDAVLSALVPGMGYVRIRYVEERGFPLTYESGHYKTLIWGKASRWAKVPWIAFKHSMSKAQMFAQFQIPPEEQANGYKPSDETEDDEQTSVYEFWDKKTRQIFFLCEEWHTKILTTAPDPLELANFFPTPGILTMTMRNGKMLPIPLYNYYKEQAEELNRVSVRLKHVLSAIRVRGFYNGMLGDDLKKLLDDGAMDNELIPAAEAGLLAQSGGIDKHIWLLPIEKMIEVAKQLYVSRESIKQVIYEITGISDIIRGASVASETATAQDLKNKWGTVRLRRMQTVVANYARDLFRLSVDCGSTKIPPQKWADITLMQEIPTAEQKQIAKQQLEYQAKTTPPPMPGMPPPQPPDPKLVAHAKSPSWEEILQKIADDEARTFTINIQTSSTIDIDTAADKAELTEFMSAMGQLLPGMQGFVQMGPTGLAAAKEILVQVCNRFKFGVDIADVIRQIEMPPPQPEEQKGPPPPSPEEIQADQMEQSMRMEKIKGEMEINRLKLELEKQKMANEQLKLEHDKIRMGIEIQQATLMGEANSEKIALGRKANQEKAAAQTAAAKTSASKPAN